MNRFIQIEKSWGGLLFAMLVLMTLSACAPMAPVPTETLPPPVEAAPSPEPREDKPEDKIRSDDSREQKPTSSAVSALVNQGWIYYRQNNYEAALSTAGRAQRIDPRSPEVYLLMASAQFSLYQLAVAEQLARKGLALAQNSSAVNRQLEALLAKITASQQ